MLSLIKCENKRHWMLVDLDSNGNISERLLEQKLSLSSITNKYQMVSEVLDDVCTKIPQFSDWFKKLIKDYIESGTNSELILNNANNILNFATIYINLVGVDFSVFTDSNKKSKTSIMFSKDDIRAIAISSTALKLYAIFCYDPELKLPDNAHKAVYQVFIKPCSDLGTVDKVFQLIRSRIYRSSITDRYIWEMIKMAISETPQSYVMTVFNYLMTNMISILEIDKNPIPFLVTIIDDSVRWLMRTVYNDKILYGEAFSGSEDIYGSSSSKDSFYVYCCNDTIGKAASIGMSILESDYISKPEQHEDIKARIDVIDSLTPPMRLLTLPIASKVFDIPYKYLLTCSPKHALLMGIFLFSLAKNIMDDKYPVMSEFLISCPKDCKFSSTRSSYRIRNLEFILNDSTAVFGFKAKTLKFDIMSSICGVLSASKKNLISVISGYPLKRIAHSSLEHDAVNFFTKFYSNQLNDMFQSMKEKSEQYF